MASRSPRWDDLVGQSEVNRGIRFGELEMPRPTFIKIIQEPEESGREVENRDPAPVGAEVTRPDDEGDIPREQVIPQVGVGDRGGGGGADSGFRLGQGIIKSDSRH